MSYHDRDSQNANSALIVTVTPEDFQGEGPLAGVEFQRRLEEKAYKLGNGKIPLQKEAASSKRTSFQQKSFYCKAL